TSEEPSPTTEETTSEPTTETSTTSTEPAEVSDGDVERFVRDYFGTVTQDRDAAWEMLSPAMQDRVGRESFDDFWSGIESVDVRNLKGDGEGLSATVTLVYQKQDGGRSTERKEYAFVQAEDGSLLIDQERNASGGGGSNDD
ncbi:MAG TPA: hypothetical protein VH915_10230, partial [Pedococcus sp.]